jgi:hypothetical protein
MAYPCRSAGLQPIHHTHQSTGADTPLRREEKAMTADLAKDLGTFIGEQNPFNEMRLPPDWRTHETIVTFPSVADFWAKLMQDPHTAVSKVIRIKYTVEG